MQRKQPASVISIDLLRQSDGKPPLPPTLGTGSLRKNGRFFGNRHTADQAIRLALGPLDYTEEHAAEVSGHPLRLVREAVKGYARREFDRRQKIGVELRRAA